ncbi:serine/arginine repetitive matrix protein 1 [Cydia fagiglandana]|uniref:serine/arginine repetitive matrix protein 1 n=1 Tax=Cydia fagiglandana TaxID=1458189 RepID=UPI002FEE0446
MSYRGAWDGGPPGAEAEYAPPYAGGAAPPPPPVMPTTDPWTGVSYSQYGPPPSYDYPNYGAANYNYNYDANYYQRPPENYYQKYPESRDAYSSRDGYDNAPRPSIRPRSPAEITVVRRRRSYTRSVSPFEKKVFSRKLNSYDEVRKTRSRSRSSRLKRGKYSSSDRSSSRSSSRLSRKKVKDRRTSSDSSGSNDSYKKRVARKSKTRDHSYTPPLKKSSSHSRNRSISKRSPSKDHSSSKSPRLRHDKEKDVKGKGKLLPSKDKAKKTRDVITPPRKIKEEPKTPPPRQKQSSITPPRSYQAIKKERSTTPPKKKRPTTPLRKNRDSSLTPPKSYARSRSSSSSGSGSRSPTPKPKSKRNRRSRSSSRSSKSRSRSRSKPRRSEHRSRTKSRSKRRSVSKSSRPKRRSVSKSSRSKRRSVSESSHSRSRSKSRGRRSRSRTSKSRSRSKSSRSSRSHSGTPSEERRGQFTVADRKRFWKLHRSRQEEKRKEKPESPPKEVKPPPGAIEPAQVDDIEYGDPPEVEGPNFAELLPACPADLQQPSSSKSKPGPIPIKNDGSFLEMFKKMQEETKKIEEKKPEIKKPVLPFIGKRRGGRVLKTGLVKKAKAIEEQLADNAPKDAWSLYMQEVKKYRETSCEEERKTRPLVK